jgi:hypothetical protein
MSVEARAIDPVVEVRPSDCAGCGGDKGAPLACVVSIYRGRSAVGISMALCEECGRDVANAVGFMCARDGGWSKLEPRKQKRKTDGGPRARSRRAAR